jgi:hypothetical protein
MNSIEKGFAVSIFLIFLKLLLQMKQTKRFGLLIQIMELCIQDIGNFIVIFLLEICAFSVLFFILFSDANEDYATFELTLKTLNNAILG